MRRQKAGGFIRRPFVYCVLPTVLEVVSNPDRKPRLAPARASAAGGKHDVFPILVEQGTPRPIEVDREPDREGLQPDAVGRARIDEPEPADELRGAPDRSTRPTGRRRGVAGDGLNHLVVP